MFIHILLVLMEYMELSVIQSLLETIPPAHHPMHVNEWKLLIAILEDAFALHGYRFIFEFMYCDFIKTKGSSYSSLFNNYIQGGQVLCNHTIVFRVLLHTDCVIYIYFLRKFLNSIYIYFFENKNLF